MSSKKHNGRHEQRQAVIIIHGIGEQRPMDTLRSFVDSIKKFLEASDASEKNTVLRSKPDGISETFETRRLSLSASSQRPITDFYEFYWAQNMRNTTFGHIFTWLIKLLIPVNRKIPRRLFPFLATIWVFIFLLSALGYFILLRYGFDKIKALLSEIVILPVIYSIASIFGKYILLNYVGDAARYFSPIPGNISERNNIRTQGVSFLKKILAQDNKEKYNRVIIVGHSLGSVIAYDLLRLLWIEYHLQYTPKEEVDQSAIKEIEAYCRAPDQIDVEAFQQLQNKLWAQQKNTGNGWLITDFVTLGSPICHADFLQISNISFDELKNQREYPTCPPLPDDKDKTIHYNSPSYAVGDERRSVKILHSAANFAVTRWTNIFFTSDFIGGPMRQKFGKGIKDIPVKRISAWFLPGGHTRYWDEGSDASIKAIVEALRLKEDVAHDTAGTAPEENILTGVNEGENFHPLRF